MGSGWDTDHCYSDNGYFCSLMDEMDYFPFAGNIIFEN